MAFQFSSIALEIELLNLLVKNEDNVEKALIKLDNNDFSVDITRILFYEITNFYKQYNKIISRLELQQKIIDSYQNKGIVLQYLVQIYDINSNSNFDYIVQTIKQKTKARKVARLIESLANSVSNGEIDKTDSLLNDYLNSYDESNEYLKTPLLKETNTFLQKIIDEKNNPTHFDGVETGILEIDKVIRGLKKSELGLVMGKTGGYKTTTLINLACNALLMSKKVAFFIIESPVEQYTYNIQSYFSEIPAEKLQKATINEQEIIQVYNIMNKVKQLGGEIIFIDCPQDLTPTKFQIEIKKAKRKYGNIDLVILDYMQIMNDESGNKTDPYDWKRLATISKQLKAIARAEQVPIWTAAQKAKSKFNPNAKKTNEETHGVEDIAYSKGITDNVDTAIEIYQSDQDRLMNVIELYFLKTRRSASLKNTGHKMQANVSIQQIDILSTKQLKEKYLFKKDDNEQSTNIQL